MTEGRTSLAKHLGPLEVDGEGGVLDEFVEDTEGEPKLVRVRGSVLGMGDLSESDEVLPGTGEQGLTYLHGLQIALNQFEPTVIDERPHRRSGREDDRHLDDIFDRGELELLCAMELERAKRGEDRVAHLQVSEDRLIGMNKQCQLVEKSSPVQQVPVLKIKSLEQSVQLMLRLWREIKSKDTPHGCEELCLRHELGGLNLEHLFEQPSIIATNRNFAIIQP
jgi:hypothetical protein